MAPEAKPDPEVLARAEAARAKAVEAVKFTGGSAAEAQMAGEAAHHAVMTAPPKPKPPPEGSSDAAVTAAGGEVGVPASPELSEAEAKAKMKAVLAVRRSPRFLTFVIRDKWAEMGRI